MTLKRAFVEAGNVGELIVEIPEECLNCVENQKVLTLHIDIIVLNPKEVIIIIINENEMNKNILGN